MQPIDVERHPLVHLSLHHHALDKQGQHHCRRGDGRGPLVPWDVLARVPQREPDRPLDQRIHQQPNDGEHRQRSNPFRFLQPYGGDSRGIFDPTKTWFSRGVLLLRDLQHLGISTPRSADSRREDEPPVLVLSPLQSRDLDSQALGDCCLGLFRLRRASPARPFFPLLAGLNPRAEGLRAPGA